LAYRRDFAIDQQNEVLGQMEILRSLQTESINLRIASKKTTAKKG
jgi:hypothetical protein